MLLGELLNVGEYVIRISHGYWLPGSRFQVPGLKSRGQVFRFAPQKSDSVLSLWRLPPTASERQSAHMHGWDLANSLDPTTKICSKKIIRQLHKIAFSYSWFSGHFLSKPRKMRWLPHWVAAPSLLLLTEFCLLLVIVSSSIFMFWWSITVLPARFL